MPKTRVGLPETEGLVFDKQGVQCYLYMRQKNRFPQAQRFFAGENCCQYSCKNEEKNVVKLPMHPI